MRISDWSSDVCSSDLPVGRRVRCPSATRRAHRRRLWDRPAGDRATAHRESTARKRTVPRVAGTTSRTRRSEEHTSELQSLMRISYAVFCLKKKTKRKTSELE